MEESENQSKKSKDSDYSIKENEDSDIIKDSDTNENKHISNNINEQINTVNNNLCNNINNDLNLNEDINTNLNDINNRLKNLENRLSNTFLNIQNSLNFLLQTNINHNFFKRERIQPLFLLNIVINSDILFHSLKSCVNLLSSSSVHFAYALLYISFCFCI